MKGIVLAAGKGTRLYPVTRHVPKPLLPLGGKPTIAHAFERLAQIGIRDVCVVAGENERELRAALEDGELWRVSLTYARQTEPLGLAHALSFAREFAGEHPFAVVLADTVFSRELVGPARRFRESLCANLSLVMWADDPRPFGVAAFEGDRIVRLVEKPQQPESHWVMAGFYFFRPQVWEVLPDLKPSSRGEFELTDAIMELVRRGENVLAAKFEGQAFDTGTRPSYLAASRHFLGGKAWIAPDAQVSGQIGANVTIGPGCKVRCEAIEDSVVLKGADVSAGGRIARSILGGVIRERSHIQDALLYGEPTGG